MIKLRTYLLMADSFELCLSKLNFVTNVHSRITHDRSNEVTEPFWECGEETTLVTNVWYRHLVEVCSDWYPWQQS